MSELDVLIEIEKTLRAMGWALGALIGLGVAGMLK